MRLLPTKKTRLKKITSRLDFAFAPMGPGQSDIVSPQLSEMFIDRTLESAPTSSGDDAAKQNFLLHVPLENWQAVRD